MQVLVTNLCGGLDATEELLAATGGGNAKLAQQALDEELRAQRQESIRAILLFAGIVGIFALGSWLLVTVTDWSERRPVSSRALPTQVGEPGAARLQAIFYNANGHSTAMLGGRTVSVGDRIGGYTVQAIGPHSVTVKSANGQEKILQMSDRRE